MPEKPIIILSGSTASGKSALALFAAEHIDCVIINCDSKQLYKEIPIITAQPSDAEKKQVPHKLYGVISVAEKCSVGRWLDMVKPVIDNVRSHDKTPILVGGTGMYIKALTDGLPEMPKISDGIQQQVRALVADKGSQYVHNLLTKEDPDTAARLEKNDGQRVSRAYEILKQTGKSLSYWQKQKAYPLYAQENFLKFFLSPPRELVYENCNKRFTNMVEAGVLDEIKELAQMQLDPSLPSMTSHGVPELLAYLKDEMTLDAAIEQAQRNTRRYIKRQFTWFRHQMTNTTYLDDADNSKAGDRFLEAIIYSPLR